MDKRKAKLGGNSLRTSPRGEKDNMGGLSYLRSSQRVKKQNGSKSPNKKNSGVFSPKGSLWQGNASINLLQSSVESFQTSSRSPKIRINDS